MKLQLLICATVLGLAACSPAPSEESGGANAKRIPLADCAAVEAEDAGADGWKHPDCRIMLPDQSEIAIEARYTPAEDDSTKVTVEVVAAGDATLCEEPSRRLLCHCGERLRTPCAQAPLHSA